jgi:hypothetical protein
MKRTDAQLVYKWYCPYKSCKDMESNEVEDLELDKKDRFISVCEHCDRVVIID